MPTIYMPVVTNAYKPFNTLKGVGSSYASHAGYERQAALAKVGAGWWYAWGPAPGGNGTPMIWGPQQMGEPVDGDPGWLMFYNEPEHPDQGTATPERGAEDWAQLPGLYPGRRYVSPGCFDLSWLERWLPLVDRMPDALAAHCYVNRDSAGAMKGHFERAVHIAEQYSIPEVWASEWSYVGEAGESPDVAAAFIRDMLVWFETQPRITRQAYFQLSHAGDGSEWWWRANWDTSLVDFDTGEITALGEAYRGPPIDYADPRADINNDGEVNIFDMVIVGSNFGKPVRR